MQVLASSQSVSHPAKVHQPSTPRSARRCLFGNASPSSNDKFVKRLLEEIHDNYKAKWEFDFLAGQPIGNSQKADQARFVYTPLAEDQVPGFYRLSSYCQPSRAFQCLDEGSENVHPDQLDGSAHTSSPLLNDSTSASSMDGSFEEVEKEKQQEEEFMEVAECMAGHSSQLEQCCETMLKTNSVVRPSLSTTITPKKQAKLTDFLPQRRKNLQRSAKKSDWKTKKESGYECCPTSPTKTTTMPISPSKAQVNRRRSTVGARLAAAASLRNQQQL